MTDLRDQILEEAKDLKTKKVDVPEWDATVWVREMTSKEQDEFETQTVRGAPGSDVIETDVETSKADIVCRVTLDENGENIFQPNDVRHLDKSGGAGVKRVFEACLEVSGYTEEDLEELGNESSRIQESSSNSDSPSASESLVDA